MSTRALAAWVAAGLAFGTMAAGGAAAPPPAQSADAAHAPAAATAVADATAPRSAKIWVGRHEEFVAYLRAAPIDRVESVPIGVTKPERALFTPGGLAVHAAVKHIKPGFHSGFWDSYKSDIAAYEVDRLLGLDMVPPTIERRVGSDLGAVQLWVEGCRMMTGVDQSACPTPTRWAKQVCRQRAFDNLVANIDRNEGNLLVDGAWNLILIDHSRAFAQDKMPFEKELVRIDRAFFAQLKTLDQASLMQHVRPWLTTDGQVRELLRRRDRIVARLEQLARERGEAVVFPFPPEPGDAGQ